MLAEIIGVSVMISNESARTIWCLGNDMLASEHGDSGVRLQARLFLHKRVTEKQKKFPSLKVNFVSLFLDNFGLELITVLVLIFGHLSNKLNFKLLFFS